jgi:hypothetical protein
MMDLAVTRFRTPVDYVDRRWARIHLAFETMVATEHSGASRARIVNFSEGGFLLDCDTPLKRGEIVELALSGLGRCRGRIIWWDGKNAGGAFESLIPANDLAEIMEKEREGGPVMAAIG